jgi:hypothetical protein
LSARHGSGSAFGVRNLQRALAAEAVENGKGGIVQRRRPREGIGELGTGGQRPPLLRRTQVK